MCGENLHGNCIFWSWALLFLCLYMRGGAVYYHFCNLTTSKNLTLACRCDTYFLAKFLPKCVCPPEEQHIALYDEILVFSQKIRAMLFQA